MDDLRSLLETVAALSIEAGRRVMQFYGQQRTDSVKADASPLTAADLASHHFLVAGVTPLLPGVPVISEESAPSSHVAGYERFWLIDPLDGTKEFIKGTGQFTVNIALIDGGKPVLGAVHAPVLERTYFGAVGVGAWLRTGSQAPVQIKCRPANPKSMGVVASKDHAGGMVERMLRHFPNPSLQSMGSSLKFCLVAEGKADVYLRDLPTMEWDTAAAQAVVEIAGGGVYDLAGNPLGYGKEGLRNPSIMTIGDETLDWKSWLLE